MPIRKIFLASSNELKTERDKFQKEINWKNTILKEKGTELQLIIWEDLSAQMSETGSQSEYNKHVKDADLFVLLAWSKVGMYTEEEFENAFGQFKAAKKPFIFTYFKTPPPENAHESLEKFKKKLSELRHFYANFTDPNDLWNQFNKELDRLEADSFAENKRPETYLTRNLIYLLKDKEHPKKFLTRISPQDPENWDNGLKPDDMVRAQNILIDYCFVWVIGSQLRRLFAIGKDPKTDQQTKIHDYIKQCKRTYRVSLQLINFLFLSKLWDEKIKKPGINTNYGPIRKFFTGQSPLELAELRALFRTLIQVFQENELEFPLRMDELGNIDRFKQDDSAFTLTCLEIEKLEQVEKSWNQYSAWHYQTAFTALTAILTEFRFFANYTLITLKKVEYEEDRNSTKRYIKDFNVLEKMDGNNQYNEDSNQNRIPKNRVLKYDDKASPGSSVLFQNKKIKAAVNLFPFLIDYNALANENDFQIYFFECIVGESELVFFSINSEKEESLKYRGKITETRVINSEEEKNAFQKEIQLDLVFKQMEAARNTILGDTFEFVPEETDDLNEDFSNI